MPTYVIEREILGIGSLPPVEMQGAAKKSNEALAEIGSQIQWVESYVTENKTYCIYIAANEELVKEHARLSGFPANVIKLVKAKIDPTTAEG